MIQRISSGLRLNRHTHLIAFDGVRIVLKKAYSDGTFAVDLDPLSLLVRQGAAVPPLKLRSVRYAGVVGPASRLQPFLVKKSPRSKTKARTRKRELCAFCQKRSRANAQNGIVTAFRTPEPGQASLAVRGLRVDPRGVRKGSGASFIYALRVGMTILFGNCSWYTPS